MKKWKPLDLVNVYGFQPVSYTHLTNYIWLAAGNLNGLNIEKFKVLRDSYVILYPDAGCYEKWSKKAVQFKSETKHQIMVSDLVEKHATNKQTEEGYDIADYIIKGDVYVYTVT